MGKIRPKGNRLLEAIDDLWDVFCPYGKFILDSGQWEEQAARFAAIFSKFLLNSIKQGSSGDGSGQVIDIPIVGDNIFTEKARNDPDYQKEIIQRALKRGKNPVEIIYFPIQEVLQVLYENEAEEIVLKAKLSEETAQLPITY